MELFNLFKDAHRFVSIQPNVAIIKQPVCYVIQHLGLRNEPDKISYACKIKLDTIPNQKYTIYIGMYQKVGDYTNIIIEDIQSGATISHKKIYKGIKTQDQYDFKALTNNSNLCISFPSIKEDNSIVVYDIRIVLNDQKQVLPITNTKSHVPAIINNNNGNNNGNKKDKNAKTLSDFSELSNDTISNKNARGKQPFVFSTSETSNTNNDISNYNKRFEFSSDTSSGTEQKHCAFSSSTIGEGYQIGTDSSCITSEHIKKDHKCAGEKCLVDKCCKTPLGDCKEIYQVKNMSQCSEPGTKIKFICFDFIGESKDCLQTSTCDNEGSYFLERNGQEPGCCKLWQCNGTTYEWIVDVEPNPYHFYDEVNCELWSVYNNTCCQLQGNNGDCVIDGNTGKVYEYYKCHLKYTGCSLAFPCACETASVQLTNNISELNTGLSNCNTALQSQIDTLTEQLNNQQKLIEQLLASIGQ